MKRDPRLVVGQGSERLELLLHRFPDVPYEGPPPATPFERRRHSVLMLHGGNTSRDTYLYPQGGLARFLAERGYDVWLLDWRGSPYVVNPLIDGSRPFLGGSPDAERRLFSMDTVATTDLPAALDRVRDEIPEDHELSIVGHCLGGGATAIATALGVLEPFRVKRTVLSTMGLFYRVPWNGWIKAEDFLLERVLSEPDAARGISPTVTPWPRVFEHAYEKWPGQWLPSPGGRHQEMLRRLSFMFGQPYSIRRFDESLRGDRVLDFFGYLHLGLYLHVGQLVRRGYAAPFDAPDVIDRTGPSAAGATTEEHGYLRPRHFRDKEVTLLCAAQNHLWHREAMDLMYDWLRNVGCRTARKHVFADYNIQELMWGARANEEVYPKIAAGLGWTAPGP